MVKNKDIEGGKIMRKILTSVLIIGVAAALMGIGTFAYFSDIESSTGNTITTGVIDLEVNGQNPWEASFSEELKPGRNMEKEFVLHMTGDSNPAKAWFRITDIVDDQGVSSEPEQEAEDGTPVCDLSNHIKVDIAMESNTPGMWMWYTKEDGGGWHAHPDDWDWESHLDDLYTLAEIGSIGWIQLTGDCDLPTNLQPCEEYTFHLSFHNTLNGDDNEYQGDTTTFTIEFYVTQTDGTGP
jgi:predicted ribosomally synthesized peptide with SipW-like signal peptide